MLRIKADIGTCNHDDRNAKKITACLPAPPSSPRRTSTRRGPRAGCSGARGCHRPVCMAILPCWNAHHDPDQSGALARFTIFASISRVFCGFSWIKAARYYADDETRPDLSPDVARGQGLEVLVAVVGVVSARFNMGGDRIASRQQRKTRREEKRRTWCTPTNTKCSRLCRMPCSRDPLHPAHK